jgi:TonB C terminal
MAKTPPHLILDYVRSSIKFSRLELASVRHGLRGHHNWTLAMDSRQRCTVAEWQDSQPTSLPEKRARRRLIPPVYLGVLGTLALHSFIFHALPIGKAIRPLEAQERAVAARSNGNVNLLLLTLPTVINASSLPAGIFLTSRIDVGKLKATSAVVIDPPILPDLMLPLSEDQSSSPALGNGDDANQTRLFGIYTGQIRARIERVWRRPRSAINLPDNETAANVVETFQCQVQIVQDSRGNVQEILLPDCNGSPAWQRSLVVAIQQASPLPAPPSTSVFSQSLSMTFVGLPFTPDSVEEEYESARTLSRLGMPRHE